MRRLARVNEKDLCAVLVNVKKRSKILYDDMNDIKNKKLEGISLYELQGTFEILSLLMKQMRGTEKDQMFCIDCDYFNNLLEELKNYFCCGTDCN